MSVIELWWAYNCSWALASNDDTFGTIHFKLNWLNFKTFGSNRFWIHRRLALTLRNSYYLNSKKSLFNVFFLEQILFMNWWNDIIQKSRIISLNGWLKFSFVRYRLIFYIGKRLAAAWIFNIKTILMKNPESEKNNSLLLLLLLLWGNVFRKLSEIKCFIRLHFISDCFWRTFSFDISQLLFLVKRYKIWVRFARCAAAYDEVLIWNTNMWYQIDTSLF